LKYNFEIKVNFIGIDKEQAEEIFRNYREENPKKPSEMLEFLKLRIVFGTEFFGCQK
jgi:hypothetical protein